MEILFFLLIVGVSALTAWLYTTTDQKDDLDDYMRD